MKKSLTMAVLFFISSVGFIGVGEALAEEAMEQRLEEIVVLGERENIPETYAGGQVARGSRIGILGYKNFMDMPFSINSFTSENIENKMSKTVAEVVKDDPAVRFQYPSGTLMENYRIRNFTFNGGNMTLNGLMGMAPYGSAATEFLERVEIQRGPNAFASGINPGGEIAGGINLVTKQAEITPTKKVTLDYTSKSQAGGQIDLGGRFGKEKEFGVRFNGVFRDGDKGVDNQSQKRELVSLNMDYTKNKFKTTLDAYYIKDEFSGAAPFLVQARNTDLVQKKIIPGVPDSSVGIDGLWGNLENKGLVWHNDYTFNKNISAYIGIGKSLGSYEGFVGGATVLNPDTTGKASILISNDSVWIDKVAYEAGVRAAFNTGSVKHEIVIGGSVLKLDNGNAGNSSTFTDNMYSPVFDGSNLPLTPSTTVKIQEYKMSSFAFADTMSFDNDKIQFTAGARRQNVDQTRYNPNTGALLQSYDKSATTPVFSIVAKPWNEKVALYASYVEGLKPGSVVPFGRGYANEGHVFAPYANKQIEFGVKYDGGKFANTLSFYQLKQPSTYTSTNSAGQNFMSMDGEQRNRGVEWMIFGKVDDNVRLLGGISYGQAKVTKTNAANEGKDAFGSPRWQANLGVEWDTPWNKDLTLSTRVIYTGKQYIDSANTMELASSTTVDLGARYKSKINGTPVTFRAIVENLFDKDYWAGCRADSVLFTGVGRTFKLSATFDI